MSFQYGQFDGGFTRTLPSREAQRFSSLVRTRGNDVEIVRLIEKCEDTYGNPIYVESRYTEKAFVERRADERVLMPGTVKLESLRLFMVPWAAIGEEGHELEIDDRRYHVTGMSRNSAFLQIDAERKVQ